MRKKEIVGEFGEAFVAQTLQNLGFEVDRLDAEGIDLAAYSNDGKKFGISVKSRCIQDKNNDGINLTFNDLCYTYEQSVKRGIVPAYAFIVHKNNRIDLFIATQELVCKQYLGIDAITVYMQTYSSKKDLGSTKSFSTSLKSREKWRVTTDPGVIYTATLLLAGP
jgi:hypothetical protein